MTYVLRNIRYLHWKSNEHLEAGLGGETDLDVLVDKAQKNECESMLAKNNFLEAFSPDWLAYPYIEDWIGFDEEAGKLLHLHLHYKLITGKKLVKEQYLPWGKKALETRVQDEDTGVYVIDPHLELINLAIRVATKTRLTQLLGKEVFPSNIWREFKYLEARVEEGQLLQLARELFGDEKAQKFVKSINDLLGGKVRASVLGLKWFVYKNLKQTRRYGIFKTLFLYYLRAFKARFLKLLEKLGFTPQIKKTLSEGRIIAIVGADGSGKSSSVKAIKKWLGWKLDASSVYLGQNQDAVSYILRVLHKDLRSVYYAWSKYRRLKKADKLRRRGSVVITDRYPQTQFRGISDGPYIDKKSSWLSDIEESMYEKMQENYQPDVVIKLNVSPEKAFARKPDHDTESVKRKIDIVKDLKFPNSVIVNVDASVDLGDMVLEIKRNIWKHLQ